MTAAGEILLVIFRQAWTFIASILVLVALLGGLAQVFKIAGGTMLGSNFWISEAVSGIGGVILIALVGFLSLPAITHAASSSKVFVGCGPISEIGQLAAMLIGGIGALRMLKGVFVAMVSTSLSSSGGISSALIEIAETVFGMLLVTVAAPVAAVFFGAC